MRIVLTGAGHAHLEVLRRFGRRPVAGAKLTLINPEPFALYSGMVPGVIAGLYRREDAQIDLARLCRLARAELHVTAAEELDLAGKFVRHSGGAIPYDILSINTGSAPAPILGADHATPVKPMAAFLAAFEAFASRGGRAAIIGGGAGGVELAFAMQARLRERGAVAVYSAGEILPGFPDAFRRRAAARLRERGVTVIDAEIARIGTGEMLARDGRRSTFDAAFLATHATAPLWIAASGLAVDGGGFARVNAAMQSVSHPDVFVAGDAAALDPPVPKSGVYAVRQGAVLAGNLRRHALGHGSREYKPQRQALYILSTGDRRAIAARNGLTVEGGWVWRWKDWLDRSFIARYSSD
jgi:selenide,water dikinase